MAIKYNRTGFTLVEVLVVMAIFSVLAIITAQVVVRVIGTTSRSTSSTKLRENLEYAIAISERSLRNAKSITSCTTTPNPSVTYVTSDDVSETISCHTAAGVTVLRRQTEQLTSDDINLTTCNIACSDSTGGTNLDTVGLVLEGEDLTSSYDAPSLLLQTQIKLRSY